MLRNSSRIRRGRGRGRRKLLLLLMLLSLAPSINRNPSAFDMSLALKPSAFTAGSASHVNTIFLRLVSTVLAAQAP